MKKKRCTKGLHAHVCCNIMLVHCKHKNNNKQAHTCPKCGKVNWVKLRNVDKKAYKVIF